MVLKRIHDLVTTPLWIVLLMACLTATLIMGGCGIEGHDEGEDYGNLSETEGWQTLDALLSKIRVTHSDAPVDISGAGEATDELPAIDNYPLSVAGSGQIDIELFSSTEKAGSGTDGWINVVAEQFNSSGATYQGRTVSVSIRPIASGLALDYIDSKKYIPDAFSPANELWGDMIASKGIGITLIEPKLTGNTAGILMRQDDHDAITEGYGTVNLPNVLQAALDGRITLAYTNPYASSTGLNMLTAMLHEFDPSNPLSETAAKNLLDFQAVSPPVAFTTAEMRNSAAAGVVTAMTMEYQAYINEPALQNHVFTPFGVRHDSPLYVFDDTAPEKTAALGLFIEYCKSDASQNRANQYGFNGNPDYLSQAPNLDGAGLYAAQKIWKENKSGGKPVVAVFVADVSGSMEGAPLANLKKGLINSAQYISSDNAIGLVSYSGDVNIELPIAPFDGIQRAKFAGAVNNLTPGGGTATYDGVLVALDMIRAERATVPNAHFVIFVLSDGEQNEGYSLTKIAPVLSAVNIPVHSISYNSGANELEQLSAINEASVIKADEDDVIYNLKTMFNAQM
ncbi:MAG: VWA domain-containing protein [Coriobacteriales bacterium]|jgi:Ca-activated chloride channel family protein|nr:VWA domain-containing protein [Coriobacteriales bacterium]